MWDCHLSFLGRTIVMRKRVGIYVAVVAAAWGLVLLSPVQAQQERGARAPDDRTFALRAAQGNIDGADLGRLAMTHATSEDVKNFAKRIVEAHSKANGDLTAIADKEKITLPKDLGDKAQQLKTKLSAMKGADFDRMFLRTIIREHKDDIEMFQSEAQNGTDRRLKDFATKTLPVLREHLRMAEDCQSKIQGNR
jgi:putative membrane protein